MNGNETREDDVSGERQPSTPSDSGAVETPRVEEKSSAEQTANVPFDGRTMTKWFRFKGGQTISFERKE
jgi:hypothetical protein